MCVAYRPLFLHYQALHGLHFCVLLSKYGRFLDVKVRSVKSFGHRTVEVDSRLLIGQGAVFFIAFVAGAGSFDAILFISAATLSFRLSVRAK